MSSCCTTPHSPCFCLPFLLHFSLPLMPSVAAPLSPRSKSHSCCSGNKRHGKLLQCGVNQDKIIQNMYYSSNIQKVYSCPQCVLRMSVAANEYFSLHNFSYLMKDWKKNDNAYNGSLSSLHLLCSFLPPLPLPLLPHDLCPSGIHHEWRRGSPNPSFK